METGKYHFVPKPGTVDPKKCSHAFAWWSVIPPSECILCGASLNIHYPTVIW
jgi:hypothetical protein